MRLTLCADDFALSPGISAAIAGLAVKGQINAVSCMAWCTGWAEDARQLNDLPPSVETGLHLVLAGEPGLPSIDTLSIGAALRRLSLDAIRAEITHQFDAFEAHAGRPPDFVDGHQHAHLLPGIRALVIEQTRQRAPNAWLRDCRDGLASMLARPFAGKAFASAAWSLGIRGTAATAGLATNASFAGHYGFSGDYAALFPAFLRRPAAHHLVMCHPGAGHAPGDRIAAARIVEAEALHRLPIADIAASYGLAWNNRA